MPKIEVRSKYKTIRAQKNIQNFNLYQIAAWEDENNRL